jgi:hypothetical protein
LSKDRITLSPSIVAEVFVDQPARLRVQAAVAAGGAIVVNAMVLRVELRMAA